MAEILTRVEVDCLTQETKTIPLTAEEIAQREAEAVIYAEIQAQREAEAQAKAAAKASALTKLSALGLTYEEAAAIAGA